MTNVWIVWEPNAEVPQIFRSEAKAQRYQAERTRRLNNRRPVFIKPAVMPDADD